MFHRRAQKSAPEQTRAAFGRVGRLPASFLRTLMPLPNRHVISPPSKDEGTVDAWSLIYFCRTHAFVIVLSTLLGATAAISYLSWRKPTYAAHATLQIASDTRNLADIQ